MAAKDSTPPGFDPPNPNAELLVIFSREGAAEERRICSDGEHALMSALRVIASQDCLRAGDSLTVERYKRPTLVERRLA
jgi:hypothetical protein